MRGSVAIRLRERLPIIERVPVGASIEFVRELIAPATQDLVVVDSLDALVSGERTNDEEIGRVIRGLKDLAIERDVAILVTASLPNLSPRADRRPILDDFGGNGVVKQTADVVLALFREDMYEQAHDIKGATELLIRKNRNGPIGYVDLYFYAKWMRFEDMLDPEPVAP